MGHASTHFPHRVHAATMASRPFNPISNAVLHARLVLASRVVSLPADYA
jgi:hypothetical protein